MAPERPTPNPRARLSFSVRAHRDLRRIDQRTRERIVANIERLAETGAGDVKRLQHRRGLRLRVGDWRVFFTRPSAGYRGDRRDPSSPGGVQAVMTAIGGSGSSAARGTSTSDCIQQVRSRGRDSGFDPQLPLDLRQGQRAPGCVVCAPLLDRADRLVTELLVSTVSRDRSPARRPSVARTMVYGRNLFSFGHSTRPPSARTHTDRMLRNRSTGPEHEAPCSVCRETEEPRPASTTKPPRASTDRNRRSGQLHLRASAAEIVNWRRRRWPRACRLSDLLRQAMARTRTWTAAATDIECERASEVARIGNLNQLALGERQHLGGRGR